MNIRRFTGPAGPAGQTMADAPHDLKQASQALLFIEKNQNKDLHQDDHVRPAPGALRFTILTVKEHGIPELVVPAQWRMMGGMDLISHKKTLLEPTHVMKHFRRMHLDDLIAEASQAETVFDIDIIDKESLVVITRQMESLPGNEASRGDHMGDLAPGPIFGRIGPGGAVHKGCPGTGDHHPLRVGMGSPDRQHLFHHVCGGQTVLIESDDPRTVSFIQGLADSLVEGRCDSEILIVADTGHTSPCPQSPLQTYPGFSRCTVIHDDHTGDLGGDLLQSVRETRIGKECDDDCTDLFGGLTREGWDR